MTEIEPSDREFEAVESGVCDIMASRYPGILTKAGSVIRELVVRPLSYILAWGTANLRYLRHVSSAAYLRDSDAVDGELADDLASNYFISRRQGAPSRGALTLNVRFPVFQLPEGAVFSAAGTSLVTTSRIVAADASSYGMDGDVMRVPSLPLDDGTFAVSIPIYTDHAGPIEISTGTPVTMETGNSDVVSVELTSAVTGGSGPETDASLMARAAYSTGDGGLGSLLGIRKVLDRAPIRVTGLNVLHGDLAGQSRARYNWVGINPGGMVDCSVRTQVQSSVRMVSGQAVPSGAGKVSLTVSGEEAAGCLGVSSLTAGYPVRDFEVIFSGDRLGCEQTVEVRFKSDSAEPVAVVAGLEVMPGVADLQRFVRSDANRFAGQDIRILAAVPVPISLTCALKLLPQAPSDAVDRVRKAVVAYVNGLDVGSRALNFSGIRESVSTAVPGAVLRLPCVMSADLRLRSGAVDTSFTDTGILDLSDQSNPDIWPWRMCYFSLIDENLRLEIE